MWDGSKVDHAPSERRTVEIKRLRNQAQVFVIHDTEKVRYYGYDYKRFLKRTSVVSDIIDVSLFFDE